MWTIPASEELSTFVAPSPSSAENVVSGRQSFIWKKSACLPEVSVTEQILLKFVYQALIFPPTHESLGTRLAME